ncbi:MAG TPA: hypothetical protein VK700_03970 [Steroidobacteraceae bacterium]|jgi:hypothetical protein|nr:hypothetical protein [Steroidobacteraceae bacterium]
MATPFEPREVDKPFIPRWLRLTLQLFARSPVRFGILIAALGWIDTSAVKLADGYVVPKIWIDRIGTLLLPILWMIVSAVSRGADDSHRTWEALSALRRRQVWLGTLSTGATIVIMQWLVRLMLAGVVPLRAQGPQVSLQHPGEFMESIAANVLITCVFVGLCYFPLLVLGPELSPGDARHLSRKAARINGDWPTWIFVAIVAVGANAVASVAPAYGMTAAAFLVFLGVFNFVAYRDIFDRRDQNLRKAVALAPLPQAAPAHEG